MIVRLDLSFDYLKRLEQLQRMIQMLQCNRFLMQSRIHQYGGVIAIAQKSIAQKIDYAATQTLNFFIRVITNTFSKLHFIIFKNEVFGLVRVCWIEFKFVVCRTKDKSISKPVMSRKKPPPPPKPTPKLSTCVAMYPYDAQDTDEISFQANDVIEIVKKG